MDAYQNGVRRISPYGGISKMHYNDKNYFSQLYCTISAKLVVLERKPEDWWPHITQLSEHTLLEVFFGRNWDALGQGQLRIFEKQSVD